MSDWVKAPPKNDLLADESLEAPGPDGMPIHIQVIAGIFVASVAFLFFFIMYAMLKNRSILYCDVFRMEKALKEAVRGSTGSDDDGRSGDGGCGARVGRGNEETSGNIEGIVTPLLECVVIQKEAEDGRVRGWGNTCDSSLPLYHGPVSIV